MHWMHFIKSLLGGGSGGQALQQSQQDPQAAAGSINGQQYNYGGDFLGGGTPAAPPPPRPSSQDIPLTYMHQFGQTGRPLMMGMPQRPQPEDASLANGQQGYAPNSNGISQLGNVFGVEGYYPQDPWGGGQENMYQQGGYNPQTSLDGGLHQGGFQQGPEADPFGWSTPQQRIQLMQQVYRNLR